MYKMKYYIIAVLVTLVILAGVCASDDDSCTIDGHVVKKGEYYHPIGKCERVHCRGSDHISGIGCGVVAIRPGSKCKLIPKDLTKPYPHCCESYEC
ncbi:la1-like protein 13 isoform X2 [Stomoxys calcitrans]|uniref:la1-like protein 13 isoform X2 n=1 Tax=Stomoxys calcitrans TaxID=35570 RepID=UPI0027E32D06|nr:la1-like protein 13 isoform X2 [Stomoxys calcitrans]